MADATPASTHPASFCAPTSDTWGSHSRLPLLGRKALASSFSFPERVQQTLQGATKEQKGCHVDRYCLPVSQVPLPKKVGADFQVPAEK